jgi:hypothetical protein
VYSMYFKKLMAIELIYLTNTHKALIKMLYCIFMPDKPPNLVSGTV